MYNVPDTLAEKHFTQMRRKRVCHPASSPLPSPLRPEDENRFLRGGKLAGAPPALSIIDYLLYLIYGANALFPYKSSPR